MFHNRANCAIKISIEPKIDMIDSKEHLFSNYYFEKCTAPNVRTLKAKWVTENVVGFRHLS